MSLFSEIFVWWHGQTMGTRFYTWRKGKLMGTDDQGNKYYQASDGASIGGYVRRWAIYNGDAEASRVPPEWHGWLHHTVDVTPDESGYRVKPWEKPHRANLTGTSLAYRPSGSILAEGVRPAATGDYEAWKPE